MSAHQLSDDDCRAETEAANREIAAALEVVLPHIQWRNQRGEPIGTSLRDVRAWIESCAPHTDEERLDPAGPLYRESRTWYGARLARSRLRDGAPTLALQGGSERRAEVMADLAAVASAVAGFEELGPRPVWVLPGDKIWLRAST